MTLPDRADPDRDIAATVRRESGRLGDFIRRRVRDPGEAEDILQDVLEEFVEAYRLPAAIEQVSAWLYRVARYRIVDRFRKKREQPLHDDGDPDDDESSLDLALPSPDAGPEAAYARSVLLDTLQQALDDLPANQREVFVAHELEGHSFKDMAARSGVPVNTLLARKRYAVLYLRSRLQPIYDELDD
ncbi:RNA polymerase sigma factor (sigma-70 family) [Rhizobacter sp. SG703]|nr:RNA polymerase sigma factor (sigma-70 family) [Rhizobacter sp. SG703]